MVSSHRVWNADITTPFIQRQWEYNKFKNLALKVIPLNGRHFGGVAILNTAHFLSQEHHVASDSF